MRHLYREIVRCTVGNAVVLEPGASCYNKHHRDLRNNNDTTRHLGHAYDSAAVYMVVDIYDDDVAGGGRAEWYYLLCATDGNIICVSSLDIKSVL